MTKLNSTPALTDLDRVRIEYLAERHWEKTRRDSRWYRNKVWVSGHWRERAA